MTSSPTPGHQPWGQESWNESWPPWYLWSKYECFLMSGVEIWTFKKFAYKNLSQCDGNADANTDADAYDRGDCNSSPCNSYRRAENCYLQSSNGINSKHIYPRVIVLAIGMSSNVASYLHEDILNGFQVRPTEGHNFNTDRQTDDRDKTIWAATWQNQQNECAPSEDSDQRGHPPSLIRIFAVRMMNLGSLATDWAHSEDSDQTGRMPRLIWVFAGRTLTLLVLSCRGSYISRPRCGAIILQLQLYSWSPWYS